MMPAAKHGDPQLGVDIHMCAVPPSPSPVPLPTPHTSIVFDPFDYVPFLGATVSVCGMKRATAGTNATAIHIPPGFPLVPVTKIPEKDDEIFMGSATVNVDGATEYAISRITDLCGNWLEFERRGTKLVGIAESEGRRIVLESDNGRITEIALHLPNTEVRHVFARYQYDAVGDLVSVVDALGQPYTFGYDAHHMVRHTDRNGLSFYYEYDKLPADAWRVKHAWGDGGLYDYRFEYFDVINERRITDSLGHVSIVKLDDRGLPINEIDPLGAKPHNRLTQAVLPSGTSIACAYDHEDNLVRYTDENGAETRLEYFGQGEIKRRIQPDGHAVECLYDTEERLIGVTNQRSETYHLRRDPLGRIVEEIDYWK